MMPRRLPKLIGTVNLFEEQDLSSSFTVAFDCLLQCQFLLATRIHQDTPMKPSGCLIQSKWKTFCLHISTNAIAVVCLMYWTWEGRKYHTINWEINNISKAFRVLETANSWCSCLFPVRETIVTFRIGHITCITLYPQFLEHDLHVRDLVQHCIYPDINNLHLEIPWCFW